MKRPVLALFVFLTALQVVPVWSAVYVPTGDGPTHIYNAWVLHGLATGTAPPAVAETYRIDWRPHPNWSGHVFMALAIAVMPPLVAEKLFLTLILATLCFGAWYLTTAVHPRGDVFAFLVFPFTYTQTLVAGYYNFSLSVGLFLIILGVWWRRRDDRRVSTIVILAALLILCYFTHIQATLLACASIGFLSLFTRRFVHLLAIVPVVPLIATFGRTEQSNVGAPLQRGIRWEAAEILGGAQTMHSLGDGQLPLSKIVAAIFAVLIVLTLIRERRREANLLGVLALMFAAMMFWLPAAAGTRDLFLQRNSLFVFLTLAAWFTPRVPRRTLLAILTAVAIANAAIHFVWFRRLGRDLTQYVRAFKLFEPGSRILPLYFSPSPSPSIVDVFVHAISYVALERRLVDYANYEPGSHYFPIALRHDAIDPPQVEYSPGTIDIARVAPWVDYVVARGLATDAPQRRTLEQLYRLVHQAGDVDVYRRKDPLVDHELVLLPLAGTLRDIGAPGGARWRVEQRITNRGAAPVRVVFRNCPAETRCELMVEESAAIASSDKFAFLHVPRGAPVDITTVVKRVDVERPDLSIVLPAPRERDFEQGGTRIGNVQVRGNKIGIRLYVITGRSSVPVTLRLRSRATGDAIAQRTIDVAGYGMFDNADLRTDFPGFETKANAVDVEIEADARVWAFVTETNDAGQTRVVTSRSSLPARATAPPSR